MPPKKRRKKEAYIDTDGAEVQTESESEQADMDEGQPRGYMDAADQDTDDEVQSLVAKPGYP